MVVVCNGGGGVLVFACSGGVVVGLLLWCTLRVMLVLWCRCNRFGDGASL